MQTVRTSRYQLQSFTTVVAEVGENSSLISLQAKTSNPPVEVYSKLLWREFFFAVGSQVPEACEMVSNPLSLQIPWEDSAEYLERWKQVSSRKFYFFFSKDTVPLKYQYFCFHISILYRHQLHNYIG